MSKIRLVFLSLLTVLAVSAVASASASAVMPAYTHPDGSLIVGLLNVLGFHLAGGKSILKGTLAGVAIEISCSSLHATGWIENSAASGMGLSLALSHYLECEVLKPAGQGCLVKNHLIHASAHDLLLLGLGGPGTYAEDFLPEEGNVFARITIEKCTNAGLNNTFTVTGSATAIVNNTNLELEFTKTSDSNLSFGGNPAEYIDTIRVEMEGAGGAAAGGIMVEDGA